MTARLLVRLVAWLSIGLGMVHSLLLVHRVVPQLASSVGQRGVLDLLELWSGLLHQFVSSIAVGVALLLLLQIAPRSAGAAPSFEPGAA